MQNDNVFNRIILTAAKLVWNV